MPETPTVTCTSLFCCWKRSAAAVVYGPTVLDPSTSIRPDRSLPPPAEVVVPLVSLLVVAAAAGRQEGDQAQEKRKSR